MNYDVIITFIVAVFALALAPGPDNIYVLLQSLVHGVRFGIATAVGLVSGCLVHTTLVAFGVSSLIRIHEEVFFSIKLLGVLYLLYLAYKVYATTSEISLDAERIPKKSVWQLVKQGVIMNVLNPKVSLFFLSFFPGFLFSTSMSTIKQFYVLGILFMLCAFVVFVTIAVLAGRISHYVHSYRYTGFILKWLQIIVFIGIAIFSIL